MRHVREHDGWIRLGRAVAAVGVLVLLLAGGWAGQAAAPVQTQAVEPYTFTMTGSDFLIPRPADQFPGLGELRLVATHQVPDDKVGWLCRFVVLAANAESVHQENYGYLVTNGSDSIVRDTESEPNVLATRLDDPTLTLGATVTLYNVIGPYADGDTVREGFVGTSVDYTVEATCNPPTQATTTTTSTSTTTPSTTTTSTGGSSSSTTTTTTPDTTTTTAPTTSTTTSVPATTTTTPTPSTTTTSPDTTSTTGGSSTTSSSILLGSTTTTRPDRLPYTGGDWTDLIVAALALTIVGAGIRHAAREGR